MRVSDDGANASVVMDAGDAGFELELRRLAGVEFEPGWAFADAAGLTREAFAVQARGEWRSGGGSGEIDTVLEAVPAVVARLRRLARQ